VRKSLVVPLIAVVLLTACFVLAGPASAAGPVASWSERQTLPGLTERTIWGRGQVYVYRLPKNVTHTGDLHVEIKYAPASSACYVYLLGPVEAGSLAWRVCPGTYGQGFLSLLPGRQVVDYAVPEVLDQTPTPESVAGDTYYVVVQAASGTSRVRLTGYLPRTQAGSTDTTSEGTYTRLEFADPASPRKTITVQGAGYGGPFGLTPTSRGRVECRLQYPADVARRVVPEASPALAASFEQYVYPYLWEREAGQIPLEQPTDSSHWDLYGQNRHAAAPLTGADWYGLQGSFAVESDGLWKPGLTYHYVPVLWLAAAAPFAQAPEAVGPPATGLATVGYKATALVPQNLRISAATKKVRKGRKATIKGTLAVPESAAPEASVHWAAPGTRVTLQRKVGAAWTPVRTARTGTNGAWRVSVRVVRSTQWRAVAQALPGLPVEYSLIRRTAVTR
jgi:hypothetical protein